MPEFIQPQIEFVQEGNPFAKLRKAYAVCYKNEDEINWRRVKSWIKSKIALGHTSPCEHVRIKVPLEEYNLLLHKKNQTGIKDFPYGIQSRVNIHMRAAEKNVEMNVRDWIALGGDVDSLGDYKEATDYATVKIICDRGISHELVRHRTMSFTQESTRYCNYSRKMQFIWMYPPFNDDGLKGIVKKAVVRFACHISEIEYCLLIKFGCTPQEARAILPNAVKTEIWITGTYSSWKQLLSLRLAPGAHPQARQICRMIVENKNCPSRMRP